NSHGKPLTILLVEKSVEERTQPFRNTQLLSGKKLPSNSRAFFFNLKNAVAKLVESRRAYGRARIGVEHSAGPFFLELTIRS
ncbi:MAG: hypothetical protein V5783_08760, partial [Pontiella sp.]